MGAEMKVWVFCGLPLWCSVLPQAYAQSSDVTLVCTGENRRSADGHVERYDFSVKINTDTGKIYSYSGDVAAGCYLDRNIKNQYVSDQIIENKCEILSQVRTTVTVDRYNLRMRVLQFWDGIFKLLGLWEGNYQCKLAPKRGSDH